MHVYSHTKGLYSSPVYPQGSVQFVLQEDEVPCDPESPNLSWGDRVAWTPGCWW